MRAWLTHHTVCFSACVRRVVRAPLGSLANVAVIGLATALPLLGLLVVENGKALAGRVAVEPTLGVFFALDATRQEIDSVESVLRGTPGVRSLQFIAREAAFERLRQTEAMREALATLRSNPLPDALVATIDAQTEESATSLAERIRNLPKVAHVQLDSDWVNRLRRMLELGSAGLLVLGTLLGAVFIAVAFNTIRAQVHSHTDELAIARQVGATKAYLRRPFLHFGALLGVLGALVAIGLVRAALAYLDGPVTRAAQAYGSSFRLEFLTPEQIGFVVVVTALLGMFGAFLAVSTHLLTNPDPA